MLTLPTHPLRHILFPPTTFRTRIREQVYTHAGQNKPNASAPFIADNGKKGKKKEDPSVVNLHEFVHIFRIASSAHVKTSQRVSPPRNMRPNTGSAAVIRASLLFSVISMQLKKKTLEVTVWDYDKSSSNDFLGEVSASGIWVPCLQMCHAFIIYFNTSEVFFVDRTHFKQPNNSSLILSSREPVVKLCCVCKSVEYTFLFSHAKCSQHRSSAS